MSTLVNNSQCAALDNYVENLIKLLCIKSPIMPFVFPVALNRHSEVIRILSKETMSTQSVVCILLLYFFKEV